MADNDNKIVVTGPLGGLFDINAEDLSKAQKDGYRVANEQELKEFEAEKKYGGLAGGAAAVGLGVLGGATAGLGEMALIESGAVSPETISQIEQRNPWLYGGAQALGILGPMAFTGGAGALGTVARATPVGAITRATIAAERLGARAFGESLGARLATRIPVAAIEGAVYGTAERAAQLERQGVNIAQMSENPALLAEALMSGAGWNTALNTVGTLIGAGFGRAFGGAKRATEPVAARELGAVERRATGEIPGVGISSTGVQQTGLTSGVTPPSIPTAALPSAPAGLVQGPIPRLPISQPPQRAFTVAEQELARIDKENLFAKADDYLDQRRAVKELSGVQTETRNELLTDLQRLEVIRDDVYDAMDIKRKLKVFEKAILRNPPEISPSVTFAEADKFSTNIKNTIESVLKDPLTDSRDRSRIQRMLNKPANEYYERIQKVIKKPGGPVLSDVPELFANLEDLKRKTQRTAQGLSRTALKDMDNLAEPIRLMQLDPAYWGKEVVDIQRPENILWHDTLATRGDYVHDVLARDRGPESVIKYHRVAGVDPGKVKSGIEAANDVMPDGRAVQFNTRSINEQVPKEADLAIQLIKSHQGNAKYQAYIPELEKIKERVATAMSKSRITADMAAQAKETEETIRSMPLGGLMQRGFETVSEGQRKLIAGMPDQALIKYELKRNRETQKKIADLLSESGPLGKQLAQANATHGEILNAIQSGGPLAKEIRTLGETQQTALQNLLESQTRAIQEFGNIQATQRAIGWRQTKDSVLGKIKSAVDRFWNRAIKGGKTVKERVRIGPGAVKLTDHEPLSMRYQNRVDDLDDNNDQIRIADNAIAQLGEMSQYTPNITNAYIDLSKRKVDFLISKRPQTLTKPSDVFAHLDKAPRVSDSQMAKFLRYADAVDNPLKTVKDFADGNLTREGAEALREVYPQIHAELDRQVSGRLVAAKEPLPYRSLIDLSILMNRPFHPSMEPKFIQTAQAVYASIEDQGAQPNPPRRTPNFAENQMTRSQMLG